MPSAADPAVRPSHDQLHHPAVDAALSTAATLLGMEVVFIGGFTDERFRFERVRGEWDGIAEGRCLEAAETFCARMLETGHSQTADVDADPVFRGLATHSFSSVTSYVGVPITDGNGRLVGTLCGIDHRPVAVDDNALAVLQELAGILGAQLHGEQAEGLVIRRTPQGWLVSGDGLADSRTDLTSAMVLADLIVAELAPGGRPARPDTTQLSEIEQLRLSVSQLEHALAARVTVEQAIGVLAERQHSTPRAAFDRLRKASRSRGRKVHDLAREVVASVTDHGVPLPPELAGR
jgi:GAF domain-containing protein